MKTHWRVILGLVGFWQAAGCLGDPLNILFFGNSFTYYNDMPAMIQRLAAGEGYEEPLIVDATSPGMNLAYHRRQVAEHPENNVAHPSMDGKAWDHVVIQGSSTDATTLRGTDLFVENAAGLLQDVRAHESGAGQSARAVLFQTWAYRPGHTIYPTSFPGPEVMQREVIDGYALAFAHLLAIYGPAQAGLAPIGEAFASLEFDESLYAPDLLHPSRKGSVLLALMLYRALYGETVSDIPFATVESWLALDKSTWGVLLELADSFAVPSSRWQGFSRADDVHIDTGSFLGWAYLGETSTGWLYPYRLGKWVFLNKAQAGSGAWVWLERGQPLDFGVAMPKSKG